MAQNFVPAVDGRLINLGRIPNPLLDAVAAIVSRAARNGPLAGAGRGAAAPPARQFQMGQAPALLGGVDLEAQPPREMVAAAEGILRGGANSNSNNLNWNSSSALVQALRMESDGDLTNLHLHMKVNVTFMGIVLPFLSRPFEIVVEVARDRAAKLKALLESFSAKDLSWIAGALAALLVLATVLFCVARGVATKVKVPHALLSHCVEVSKSFLSRVL
eukprot:tig00021374_g21127.t1